MSFKYSAIFVVLVVCSSTQGFRVIRQAEAGTSTVLPGNSESTILSSESTGVSVGSTEVTGVATGVTGVPGISGGNSGSGGQPPELLQDLEKVANNLAQSIEGLRSLLEQQIQDPNVEQIFREQLSVLEQNLVLINHLLVSLGGSPVSVPTVLNVTRKSTVSSGSSVSGFSSSYAVSPVSGASSVSSSSMPIITPGFPMEV